MRKIRAFRQLNQQVQDSNQPSVTALNYLSVKSQLQIVLLVVSLGSIVVTGYIGWSRAQAALRETIFNQLTSVRASKGYQIESYFKSLSNHVETLSEDRMVVAAMVGFEREFGQLNQKSIPVEWNDALKAYYTKEFFPRLSKSITGEPSFETYRPNTQAAQYLQHHYIAKNSYPVGKKDELIDAGDGSQYSKLHAQYHPIFRNLIKKFGYYDLFLINFKTGDIVYTVYKETDFSTNLNDGPYRGSNLAEVVAAVRENPDRGAIQLVDFEAYRPSYMAPAAFLAAPIYDGSQIVGILAIQLPVDEINNVLTGNKNWKRDGLANTGETYLVGSDFLMRSISRFLIEDREDYTAALRAKGTPEKTIRLIEQLGTSTLLQKVETEASRAAIGGIEGTKIVKDYRGKQVLSSYSPVRIAGVNWAILAEMDLAEAYQPVYTLQNHILISTVVLILCVTFAAGIATHNLVRPITTIIAGARRVQSGELDVEVQLNYRNEFGELGQLFNGMTQKIREQTGLIDQKNRENEVLLLNILPRPVVERLQKGEERIADHVQQVTVLFASLIGFSKLTANQDIRKAADMLNELVSSFDEEAEKHDVERLSIVGDRYVAVCGLTKPRLDHTKRIVDFAWETLEIVQGFNNTHGTRLSLRIGIQTGAVMAGIIGTKKFTYDLWGETVSTASYLETQAEANTILVTQNVYERLHDLYNFQKAQAITLEDKAKLATWVLEKAWLRGLIDDLGIGLDIEDEEDDFYSDAGQPANKGGNVSGIQGLISELSGVLDRDDDDPTENRDDT